MKQLNNTLCLIAIVLLTSCGGSTKQKNVSDGQLADQKTEIKLKQYKVKGSKIYNSICANCHQKTGTGLGELFPPLAGSDYLLSDLKRAACIIKNGQNGEIVVNGKTYNQMMPANTQLTPLEVAEVLTYISNSWGNDAGLTGVKEVEKWLNECN